MCRALTIALALALVSLVLSAAVAAAPAAAHSVMVVAPHPDDDLLYGAGVVARALAAGDTVTVVYMTNGDVAGVASGLTREDEAVAGQAVLGTPENDLIFLGYPDTGLWDLFNVYTSSGSDMLGVNGVYQTYGDRGLGRSDYHFYEFGTHAAYNRPNVLADLDSILSTYRPDDVYTTGELDIHSDHSTTYDFVKLALLDRMASDSTYRPILHSTIVHTDDQADWPAAMDPTTPMTEPPGLPASGPQSWGTWEHLPVPAAMQSTNLATNPKVVAIDKHASQGGTGDFLGQFVHSDEIFWPEQLGVAANRAPTAVAGPAQTVATKAAVTLEGSASSDPDGDPLSYAWTQTAGPTVTLSSASAAKPSFSAPASATSLTFQLVVSDGKLSSSPASVTITVQASGSDTNIASLATATASSQTTSTGQTAAKAIDGVVGGYPGDYTKEWASSGQGVGAWLKLTWPSAEVIDAVVLHDRPNTNDQITAATLTFSDGSSVPVGVLPNDDTGLTVTFAARSVTSLTLTVTTVSSTTRNVGLAEIEVDGHRP